MLLLVLALLAILALAALVVAFVAYPLRGRAIPRAPRLSGALQELVDRTGLDPDEDAAVTGGSLTELREQWRERDGLPPEPRARADRAAPRR